MTGASEKGLGAQGFKGWIDGQTFCPIALSTGLGIGLLALAICRVEAICPRSTSLVCGVLRDNTPWTLMTAIVAGPSALLTWYWRTDHKKRDIDQARTEEINSRFAKAAELLGDGHGGGIYALEAVAQDAPARYHSVVFQTLVTAVQGWSPWPSANQPTLANEHVRFVLVQALVRAIGKRDKSHDVDLLVDLSSTDLTGVDFGGLNFDGARFDGANLSSAILRNASFLGASFGNVKAVATMVDGTTLVDAVAAKHLQIGGLPDNAGAKAMWASALKRAGGEAKEN